MTKVFDLKYQLLQYGSHHHNLVNVAIHLTCIPLILWTALVFAAKTGPLIAAPSPEDVAAGAPLAIVLSKVFEFCTPNLSLFWMTAYVLYYIRLDVVAGLISAPLFIGCARLATQFYETNPDAINIAIGVHAFAWIAQFIGHGVFEKRAPKLFDNLLQALVLAPYFVVYEVLFFIGYRPQLKKELDILIVEDIARFRAKKDQAKQGEREPLIK
ncbi:hypothetical protein BGZ76_008954 [Entomortierella beljakovae]|nr:hypothetical protein BGZ76_008954 [Entomortierella beljakovae]